jgi:5-methylcytosine-specific restriction endonuclease McrA
MALRNWNKCFENGRGYCTYCGDDLLASISTFWAAQRDHVIAQAADGSTDEIGNLAICCPSCNQALAASNHLRTVEERRQFIKRCLDERRATYEEWRKALREKQTA